jgi:hypothetical protein
MTSISVEQLTFIFDSSVVPFQYEKDAVCVAAWPQDSKVVDVVAHDLPVPAALTWLIEAKDYRVITNPPKPTNLTGLAATVLRRRCAIRSLLCRLLELSPPMQQPKLMLWQRVQLRRCALFFISNPIQRQASMRL